MSASGLPMQPGARTKGRGRALLLAAVLGTCSFGAAVEAADAEQCPINGDDNSICNVPKPEDMAPLANSEWVIVSSYSTDAVYRVSTRTRQPMNLIPNARARWDKKAYPDCPGPLSKRGLTAHGIAATEDAKPLLFVINHGSREAIEVYRVRPRNAALTWIGCVPVPDDMMANSIVRLRSGGLVVTSLGKPKTNVLADIVAGRPTGDVRQWSKASGWVRLVDSEGSGPNGLALAPDQRSVYVAMSGSREVVQIWLDGTTAPRRSQKLGILPDNLRWTARGTLITTGMQFDPETNMGCFQGKACLPPFDVYEITPGSLAIKSLSGRFETRTLPLTTTALEVGKELWISGLGGKSIAVFPLKAE